LSDHTQVLIEFLSALDFDQLPAPVVARTEELFLDWVASALAGRDARPVRALLEFGTAMGPASGPSEVLVNRANTSPWFAALINAAASHVVEQDDLHNQSVLHPGAVVFPAVLAAAQALRSTGRDFLTAAACGYEAGTRVGAMLGRSHYRVFHTTGTAGTIATAAGVARLLRLDVDGYRHAIGSAGTQAAGLWAFLRDAADSKQLHTAKAAADGLMSAYLARDGLTAAHDVLTGPQGMAEAMSSDAVPACLTDDLGTRWAVAETSFKWHASCRHTHPAADALLGIVIREDLDPDMIDSIRVAVYQAAMDVLGPVREPRTIHQSKFCMGHVLALIARYRRARLSEFSDSNLHDEKLRALSGRVTMIVDPQIDRMYPGRWASDVEVLCRDGRKFRSRIEVPKGDPGNPLSRSELIEKVELLSGHAGGATPAEVRRFTGDIFRLHEPASRVGFVLGPAAARAGAGSRR